MTHPVHLILSVGTRVVTRNEVNRIGGGAGIAAGAVAVIIESPSDAQHAYKVRFNDGTEAMVRRSEFSILKEFKGVVQPAETALGETDEFDAWEPFIIYRCIVGSQAFGLSDRDSDVDRRGIYLPPAELHWSLYGVPEQINPNRTGPDADNAETYWELQKFLIMALKANPNILEWAMRWERCSAIGRHRLAQNDLTHTHPEGAAGAVAVALAAAMAWQLRDAPSDRPRQLFDAVLRLTPESEVRRKVLVASTTPAEVPVETVARLLGNGSLVTAPDTVPFCIWMAAWHLESFVTALGKTIAAGGDCDTNAAIVGGIVALSAGAGIPGEWQKNRESAQF